MSITVHWGTADWDEYERRRIRGVETNSMRIGTLVKDPLVIYNVFVDGKFVDMYGDLHSPTVEHLNWLHLQTAKAESKDIVIVLSYKDTSGTKSIASVYLGNRKNGWTNVCKGRDGDH